jgi:hypothetical protein
MPPEKISNMSLNCLRRQVATHDKNIDGTWMEKTSIALDLGHRVSSSGVHMFSFHFSEMHLLEDLRN